MSAKLRQELKNEAAENLQDDDEHRYLANVYNVRSDDCW
jgi:hypothetical protein